MEEFCTCIYSCLGTIVLKVVGFLKTLKYAVKFNVKYKSEEIYISEYIEFLNILLGQHKDTFLILKWDFIGFM